MVVSMEKWVGKVAIVTGASTGIGAAIAEALVESGLQVVGLARRKEKIDELAEKLKDKTGKLYSVKTDITIEEDILNAFKWIKNNNLGPVHILINNAGTGKRLLFTESDTETWRQMFDTNFMGLSIATREALKNMQENKVDGHIININSLLGHRVFPLPCLNMYPATKFAGRALQETLRVELASLGSKIKLTNISPGVVDTEIWDVSGFKTDSASAELLTKVPKLQPQDVADTVVFALSTPSHVQITELIVQPVGEMF